LYFSFKIDKHVASIQVLKVKSQKITS
jgi:hypothetical protein